MQPLGILIAAVGVWIVYAGYNGVPPLDLAKAIIANPDKARQLIEDAKAEAKTKYSSLISAATVAYGTTVTGNNPFSKFEITDDWAAHEARGSGGIDFAMPVGTPLVSAFSGIATEIPNSGGEGHVVKVKLDNGYVSVYKHLSRFAGVNGKRVNAGTIVGYSGGAKGAEGAGSSTGPHLHWNMLDPKGNRVNPLTYGISTKAV